jgi:predicted dehydrogenase
MTRLFIDAILMDRPLTPTFSDGYQAQLVIDAVLESHKRGQWVTIT